MEWFFEVIGKLEAETESKATDLIYEMLKGTQFQITSLENESD